MKADHIVFASHFPFPRWPGFYSARMHQERSYVLALETEDWDLGGMYYGIDPDGLSFRNAGELVLVGGMGHRTGEGRIKDPYGELEEKSGEYLEKSRDKGVLVGPGLHDSGFSPLYWRFLKASSVLACGHRIRKMGNDQFYGFRHGGL